MKNLDKYFDDLFVDEKALLLRPITEKVSLLFGINMRSFYYKADVLDIDSVLPEKSCETNLLIDQKKYLEDVENIKILSSQSRVDTIHYLNEKYFSRSGSRINNYISVFNKKKIDCAIRWLELKGKDEDIKTSEEPYVLIKGDISGIQNFIYSVPDSLLGTAGEGKRKAKRLRGRSFYISLLTDTISDVLVRDLNLQEASILYAGGGHFTILAPNTPKIKTVLADSEKVINKYFLNAFQLQLTLVLKWIDVQKNIVDDYRPAYQNLEDEIVKAKKQKAFSELFVFTDCINEKYEPSMLFEDIGSQLTRTNFLIEIYSEEIEELKRGKFIRFSGLNITWWLVDDLSEISKMKDYRIRVFSLNNPSDFLDKLDWCIQQGCKDIAFGFKFIGNYIPTEGDSADILGIKMNKDEPLDFEQLARLDVDGENKATLDYPLLGVLRLDVDNLGAIFGYGLEHKGKTSLYEIAALSREFIHFFCFYMNKLAEDYRCYVTYSGGDDAFIVGSWINILRFTRELRNDFGTFCCDNPNLSFSAGIIHCDSHYPIQKAAQHAGSAEEKAKDQKDKNALSIFGREVKWDQLSGLIDFAEKIVRAVESENGKEKISRSVIYRILLGIYDSFDEKGGVKMTNFIRLGYMLRYWFARSPHDITHKKIVDYEQGRFEKLEGLKLEIAQQLIKGSSTELFKNYSIVMNYVLLKTRKSRD